MSKGYQFLYVEDDATSRMVMELILPYWDGDWQLVTFADSADFINRLEAVSPKPDVIFLDIHMEPHTGFEMLDMIRDHEVYQDTRVIALTASVMNEEVEQMENAGFTGAIAKPLDREKFPELLDRILNDETVWYIS